MRQCYLFNPKYIFSNNNTNSNVAMCFNFESTYFEFKIYKLNNKISDLILKIVVIR